MAYCRCSCQNSIQWTSEQSPQGDVAKCNYFLVLHSNLFFSCSPVLVSHKLTTHVGVVLLLGSVELCSFSPLAFPLSVRRTISHDV